MIQHVFWLSLIGVHIYIYIYYVHIIYSKCGWFTFQKKKRCQSSSAHTDFADHVCRFSFTPIYYNVGNTIMNYPSNHHFYSWYKPFPNRWYTIPIGSMYAIYIYTYIYHQYTPNVSIYTIHGSYGIVICPLNPTVNRVVKKPPRWECSMARVRHVRAAVPKVRFTLPTGYL